MIAVFFIALPDRMFFRGLVRETVVLESLAVPRDWHLLRTGPEWLAVAEFHVVAGRVAQATVIAHRVGLIAWRPDQATLALGQCSDTVDLLAAAQGKTEVTVVVGRQVAILTARHDDEDELVLLARFGHPDNTRALAWALVDHLHAAESRVESDTGIEIGDVQGQMSQGRAHINLLLSA